MYTAPPNLVLALCIPRWRASATDPTARALGYGFTTLHNLDGRAYIEGPGIYSRDDCPVARPAGPMTHTIGPSTHMRTFCGDFGTPEDLAEISPHTRGCVESQTSPNRNASGREVPPDGEPPGRGSPPKDRLLPPGPVPIKLQHDPERRRFGEGCLPGGKRPIPHGYLLDPVAVHPACGADPCGTASRGWLAKSERVPRGRDGQVSVIFAPGPS